MHPQKCSRVLGHKASAKIWWGPQCLRNHLPRNAHMHGGHLECCNNKFTRKPRLQFKHKPTAAPECAAKPRAATHQWATSEPPGRPEGPNREPRCCTWPTLGFIPLPFNLKHKSWEPGFPIPSSHACWKLPFIYVPCHISSKPLLSNSKWGQQLRWAPKFGEFWVSDQWHGLCCYLSFKLTNRWFRVPIWPVWIGWPELHIW